MDHLDNYIAKRKNKSKYLSRNFDHGYHDFKIGAMLKLAREESGLTQEEIAIKLKTKKSRKR